jgi:hypothetical protein
VEWVRKTITIEFDSALDKDLYADAACAVWMQLQAMSRVREVGFTVTPDGPDRLDRELDAHWDRLGRENRWRR